MAVLVFQHSSLTGPERLGATLRNYGQRLRIVRPDDPEAGETFPADLDDVDSVLVLGGPQSATAPTAWMRAEMELIREADERDLPVLGICLGSNIVAAALDGEIGRNESGMEVGFKEVRLTPAGREDPLFAGLGWAHYQFLWHGDAVVTLPPDARLLGSTADCSHQAWVRGRRTYGVQFHPEVSTCCIEGWIEAWPDDLERGGVTGDELRDQMGQHYATFERITQRLFDSIALFLMPVDRRYAGIAKDIHH